MKFEKKKMLLFINWDNFTHDWVIAVFRIKIWAKKITLVIDFVWSKVGCRYFNDSYYDLTGVKIHSQVHTFAYINTYIHSIELSGILGNYLN